MIEPKLTPEEQRSLTQDLSPLVNMLYLYLDHRANDRCSSFATACLYEDFEESMAIIMDMFEEWMPGFKDYARNQLKSRTTGG